MTKQTQFLIFAATLPLLGCATGYSLKPSIENPEMVNGVAVNTLVTPKCVLQAGSKNSTKEELFVDIRVLNKTDASFDMDSSYFTLTGSPEVLKESPLPAIEPEKILADLKAQAELEDSRAKMEYYQGIEEISDLKIEGSNAEIDRAKSQFKEKQKEATRSQETAVALRERILKIQSAAFRKSSIKPGTNADGAILFKTAFKGSGPVTLESNHPACQGKLEFILKD